MSKENVLKRHWNHLFNDVKERYPDLTRRDFDYIAGEEDRLVETVEKRRHISPAEAERDVRDFLDNLDVHQRMPQ